MENEKNNEVTMVETAQQNDTKQNESLWSEEFLKRVEQAAARGAKKGSGRSWFSRFLQVILPIAVIAFLIL